jgi:hypothetical protein
MRTCDVLFMTRESVRRADARPQRQEEIARKNLLRWLAKPQAPAVKI